jgi:hypothetical protein
MTHNNTNTGNGNMTNYQLSPAQKTILAASGENVNFQGDDNDFSCALSRIALTSYMAGDVLNAWRCYQNDPMACYGVTFAAWDSGMKSLVIRHLENERATAAHSAAMAFAG